MPHTEHGTRNTGGRARRSAFTDTGLNDWLRGHGVTQVVRTGIAKVYPRIAETGTTKEVLAALAVSR